MAIGARGGSAFSLQRILNRVLRCSHRRQSRPITPRGGGQAYAVCLDCGTRLAYDLNAIRVEAAVPGVNLNRQSSEVGKDKVIDIPPQEFVRGATGRWLTMWSDSRLFHRDFGATAVLWIGAISLAAGLLYLPNRPEGPKNLTTPEKARSSLAANTVTPSPSLPVQGRGTEGVVSPQATKLVGNRTASTQPKSNTGEETIGSDSTSLPAPLRHNQVLRLQGNKSAIVLEREALAAMELSQHPGRLRKLIRNGSLFTVPRGTAVELLQENGLVSKVLITEGPMLGQEGWAPTWQTRSWLSADTVKPSTSLPVEERGTEGVLSPTTELAGNRKAPTQPKSNTVEETVGSDSTSVPAPLRSNQVLRLQGKKSVIVLGREAVAAAELSPHPGRLRKLIRNGSLFTVPRGTTIKLLQENRLVSKVLITEGSMLGQEGWAPTCQLSR